MADQLTADDLRALADMVAALNEASRRTGVAVKGWDDDHLMIRDHAIRIEWRGDSGDKNDSHHFGHYVVEYPDPH